MMLGIGLTVAATVGMVYSSYLIGAKEDSSILSSKRLGMVMLFLFTLVFILGTTTANTNMNILLNKCYENNITLTSQFDHAIKDIKIERFRNGL